MSGFVSNGEYNSLRSTGYSRPLSVLQLKANAQAKYVQLGKTKMLKMLSPVCESHTCTCAITSTHILFMCILHMYILVINVFHVHCQVLVMGL